MRISVKDMQRLAANPSAQARAEVGGKVASTLSAGAFTERETTVAIEILRLLVRDTEMQVRRAIAIHLRDALGVPHDMVMQLAQDIENDVALPLLRYSYALTEDDLIEIVKATGELARLTAIASRESVSTELAEALLNKDIIEVMGALFANPGANLRDQQLLERWSRIAGNEPLLQALVHRGGLSVLVAEKLYAAVSDEMKPILNRMYKLPMILLEEANEETREWAMLELAGQDALYEPHEHELESLVDQLYVGNRLSYSIIMRALCVGDLHFFEAAMAKLAGISRQSARMLMFDSGPLGFKAFYEKACMPEGFFAAVDTLLKISLEETAYGRIKREDFRSRVIARIKSAGYDQTVENMQYMLTIIGGKTAPGGAVH